MKPPASADGAGKQRGPIGGRSAAGQKGRILLLEDDAAFREVIEDFLTESGYRVVAVPNGAEGVLEVLKGDFLAIVCDMMMPGLPGDLFYRAVLRTKPALCERFIFMTGHRGDAQANHFIKSVNGYVLRKPFRLEDLADSIAVAEVRATFQSVFSSAPTEASDFSEQAPEAPDSAIHTASAARIARAKFELERSLALGRKSREAVGERVRSLGQKLWGKIARRETAEQVLVRRSRHIFLVTLALAAAVAVGAGAWYWQLGQRHESQTAEIGRLEREWGTVSARLDRERRAQVPLQAFITGVRQAREEFAADRWTSALRSIERFGSSGLEVRAIQIMAAPNDPKARELRIAGTATGPEPRALADRFLQALQRDLQRQFSSLEPCRFEQLEDQPRLPATSPDQAKATFTIIAPLGAAVAPATAPPPKPPL